MVGKAGGEPKPLFVVGCPRSGTTWVSFLLAEHPAVVTFQHAKLFEYLFHMRKWYKNKAWFSFVVGANARGNGDGGAAGATGTGPGAETLEPEGSQPQGRVGVRLAHLLPKSDYLDLLSQLVREIFARVASVDPDVQMVLDKTPENGRFAPFISRLLPDAYFLHVVRDPRSVFCSHRAASKGWAKMEFPTRAADSAGYWKREVKACLRIEQLTERYKMIRYEDLQEDAPRVLEEVADWLGLPLEPGFAERAVEACAKQKMRRSLDRVLPGDFVRTAPTTWRDELTRGEVRAIEYIAGDLMSEVGYELTRKPGRKPFRVWFRQFPSPFFRGLEKRARSSTQRLHWGWVGRRLEYPEP